MNTATLYIHIHTMADNLAAIPVRIVLEFLQFNAGARVAVEAVSLLLPLPAQVNSI
jgi:hypothetical protein